MSDFMVAFFGNANAKNSLILQLENHYKADEIVKGRYWEDGKGCAVGCCIHDKNHNLFPKLFGIPVQIAYLIDSIFEGLQSDQAKKFPLQVISVIPVGSDLSKVWNKFAVWLLSDPQHGVIRFNPDHSIIEIASLHQIIIDGGEVKQDTWSVARSAAYVAADTATTHAARAAAYTAVNAARAATAPHAAAAATYDATNAVPETKAVRYAVRAIQAKKLISLLKSTETVNQVLELIK